MADQPERKLVVALAGNDGTAVEISHDDVGRRSRPTHLADGIPLAERSVTSQILVIAFS
jgi:hypothetical protein